jgi:hypothetical protein
MDDSDSLIAGKESQYSTYVWKHSSVDWGYSYRLEFLQQNATHQRSAFISDFQCRECAVKLGSNLCRYNYELQKQLKG